MTGRGFAFLGHPMIIKILAGLLLACLICIGIQQWRVSHYKARAESLQSVANTLHEANVANQATIAALKSANDQWADKYAADAAKANAAAEASRQSDAARIDKLTQLSKRLAELIKHDANVKNWSVTDVPADVVRVLAQGDQN